MTRTVLADQRESFAASISLCNGDGPVFFVIQQGGALSAVPILGTYCPMQGHGIAVVWLGQTYDSL
jgi:hypothetical protein